MIDVQQITDLHATTVRLWHTQEISNPYSGVLAGGVPAAHRSTTCCGTRRTSPAARRRRRADRGRQAGHRRLQPEAERRHRSARCISARRAGRAQDRARSPPLGRTPKRPAARSTGCRSWRCAAITCRNRPTGPTPAKNIAPRRAGGSKILAEQHHDLSASLQRVAGRHLRRPQTAESLLPVQDVQRSDPEPVSVSGRASRPPAAQVAQAGSGNAPCGPICGHSSQALIGVRVR